MPRPSKGARLYLRARPGRAPVYLIRDEGGVQRSTGTGDRREAETALAAYIAGRDRPRGPLPAAEMTVAQALDLYATDHASGIVAQDRVSYAMGPLLDFFGPLPVSEVKGTTCRRYSAQRKRAPGTVRRELGVLRAALNFCAREGHLLTAPVVWMPPPGDAKDRWLTRLEVAYLLRACRRLRLDGRHLARFILAGLYTGTRKAATLALRIDQPSTDGGWIDTERGILHRKPMGRAETKKRQPTVRVPPRLLAHVRRWKRIGHAWWEDGDGRRHLRTAPCLYVVADHRGRRVSDCQTAWAGAAKIATALARAKGLDLDLTDTSPHVLRHTAATWGMQGAADRWELAGFLGMSVQTLERVYGHHHPDHQETAIRAISAARHRNGTAGKVRKDG